LPAGCNFAICQTLLAVIGGVSAVLYNPYEKHDNIRFKGLLREYYPWQDEPNQASIREDLSTALYEVFRNPLTHDLGLDVRNKRKGAKLVLKRRTINEQEGCTL
jgi:hypothetical protein